MFGLLFFNIEGELFSRELIVTEEKMSRSCNSCLVFSLSGSSLYWNAQHAFLHLLESNRKYSCLRHLEALFSFVIFKKMFKATIIN